MRFATLIAAAGLLLPVPGVLAASQGASAIPDKERLVCKNRLRTGTRFPKKMCRTVDQWELMAEENKRSAKEIVDRPMIEIRRDQ